MRDTPEKRKDYKHYWYAPVYTGLAGSAVGAAVGAWRGQSALLFSLHLGIGYTIFGASFSSSLYGLEYVRQEEGILNWVGAGAVAGAVTSLITAGPRQAGRGAVFFGGMGMIAESISDLVESSISNYKDRRAKQRFGHPTAPSAWGGDKAIGRAEKR
ncbi:hypothetical protein Naga_100022g42 [Nannochloropsis gaditana]|uniref:Uncharacterized protein n=1 Tax=Nannochloropsis gaditana TaxID=72520 RepID=W7U1S5_9STRA|nr:hypothetical protein Naga_100022g42 [Nannochloropsis gaditana]